MKISMVGRGAFAKKHLAGLARIDGVEVASIVGRVPETTEATARQFDIPHWTTSLEESLEQPGIEAAILTSPTQVHAAQAEQVMRAGKHVEIEIPIADSLADSRRILEVQQETRLVAMAGHTRRFNPSHQWIRNRIAAGELSLQHLVVQTFFFRRTNMNAEGQPRSWTDHLLWHHACHTVDLFQYHTGETASGAVCTLALSFNNKVPLGTFFRYICDNGTYIARYDDLVDGDENAIDVSQVDVSMDGIELQDREFIAAVRDGREPNASVAQVLPAMETLHRLEQSLG